MGEKSVYTPGVETVTEYSDAVYRLAYCYMRNREDAEDVCQEVFLRLFRKQPVFESPEHCRNWLYKVTANCAKTALTTAFRRHSAPLEEAEHSGTSDEYHDSGVLEAVAALPEKQRICIHLFYYEEFSLAEISKVTGLRLNTVKSHLQRARATLAKRLEDYRDEF